VSDRVLNHPRGYNLIELMMVVAVVAILAAIVIPTWSKESGKSKARSEVSAVFAEFQSKEEQYHAENGVYLVSGMCPATPNPSGQDVTAAGCTTSAAWLALRIASPEQKLLCTYEVQIGAAGTNPTPPIGTLNTNPASSWYWIHAKCDMDHDTTKDSEYLSSNLDSTIQSVNEGY
jgi:type IV pilus assembly protein PilE